MTEIDTRECGNCGTEVDPETNGNTCDILGFLCDDCFDNHIEDRCAPCSWDRAMESLTQRQADR